MPLRPLHTVPQMRGLDPGGAEDGAAAGEDAAHRVQVELEVVALQETFPAVPETDDLVAVVDDGTVHDGPDDGVQAGAVAAGREDTNAHSPKYLLNVGRGPDHVVRLDPGHPTGVRGWHRTGRPPAGRARTCERTCRQAGPMSTVAGRAGKRLQYLWNAQVTRAAGRPRSARCAAPRTSGHPSAAGRSHPAPASAADRR